jgi:hypothetical protein
MPNILDKSVIKTDNATWDFQCPGVTGSSCGDESGPFRSTGWPMKKSALARGRQHLDEHAGRGVSQTLEDFRRDQGLTVEIDGTVKVEDL